MARVYTPKPSFAEGVSIPLRSPSGPLAWTAGRRTGWRDCYSQRCIE